MIEVFAVQLLTAAAGAVSTAAADRLYHRARIGQRLHTLWVSVSIAVICLPVLIWTCNVFLGFGALGQLAVGVVAATVFLWVHQSLRRLPAAQNSPYPLAPRSSERAVPPASKFNM